MQEAAPKFDLLAAPAHIGRVSLRVHDLVRLAEFYQHVLGLAVLDQGAGFVSLGTAGNPLLLLQAHAAFAVRDPRAAGLYHTAFLLPERADLARWLQHAIAAHIPLQGASDHRVSEAVYLADPEGNGIEVYADRPPAVWRGRDGGIRMSTEPLAAEELLRETAGTEWTGFPPGGLLGHVHLQVGDIALAEQFYGGVLGFDTMLDYPGAKFFGSGGYHHQLAGNIWHSRNAVRRDDQAAGLGDVEIRLREAALMETIQRRAGKAAIAVAEDGHGGLVLDDPWGTTIRLTH